MKSLMMFSIAVCAIVLGFQIFSSDTTQENSYSDYVAYKIKMKKSGLI